MRKKTPNSQGGANKDIVMGFKERDGKIKAYIIPNVKHETLKFMIDSKSKKNLQYVLMNGRVIIALQIIRT